nr:hypothetical protein [Phaeobacter sp. J2-8]
MPESHSWHIAATGFADEVTAKTDGRVKIEVFASGQLGSEKEVIEGLQFGSVQAWPDWIGVVSGDRAAHGHHRNALCLGRAGSGLCRA